MNGAILSGHDPRWQQQFEQEKSVVIWAAEGWISAIEHVGSTAVAEMPAVPVIDLLAGVEHENHFPEVAPYLEGINYRRDEVDFLPEDMQLWRKPFVGMPTTLEGMQKGDGLTQTHAVLLAVKESETWRQTLGLRELLRNQPEQRERFAQLKRSLFVRYGGAGEGYEQGKQMFFMHLLEQVSAWLRDGG